MINLVDNSERALSYATTIMDAHAANDDPEDFQRAIVDLVPAILSTKISWNSENYVPTLKHCLALMEAVITTDDIIIDVEGCFYGGMFRPADLVLYKQSVITMIDFTSDRRLGSEKEAALDEGAIRVRAMYPDCTVAIEVRVFDRSIQVVYNDDLEATHEDDYTAFKADYLKAMIDNTPKVEELQEKNRAMIIRRAKSVSYVARPYIEGSEAVALGNQSMENIDNVLREMEGKYPAAFEKLSSILEDDFTFAKGLAPPAFSDEEKTFDERGMGHFFKEALLIEDGESIGWKRDVGVSEVINFKAGYADTDRYHMALSKVGGNVFKFSVGRNAPENLLDFLQRDIQRSRKIAGETMTVRAMREKFKRLEGELLGYTACEVTNIPDCLVSAKSILDRADIVGDANVFAARVASMNLQDSSNTVGSKFLAMARLIHGLAMIDGKGSGNFNAVITSHASGRIMQITKKTGTLGERHTTSCIVAVLNPMSGVGTWESCRTKNELVSKCLLIRRDTSDWYSAAPGAVAGLLSSYKEEAVTDDEMITSFSATASLLAVCARKSFNVMMGQEKLIVPAAISFASDFCANIEKMESICMCGVEQLVASRLIIRGIAACLVRDTGSLSKIVKSALDGTKSIAITPTLALRGQVTSTGNANSFYYAKLCPKSYSNRAAAEAIAFREAIKGTEAVEGWRASDDEKAWGAPKRAVNAWRAGRLDNYVRHGGFLKDELGYHERLADSPTKFASSIAFLYMVALHYPKKADFKRHLRTASTKSSASVLTTKKAFDSARYDERNSRDYAFVVNAEAMLNILFPGAPFDSFSIRRAMSSLSVDISVTTDAMAIRYLRTVERFILYVTVKDDSIEKIRDITLTSAEFRFLQLFIEAVSKEIGVEMDHTALSVPNKMSVLLKACLDVGKPEKGEHLFFTASDISGYGHGKDPIGMLATMAGLGSSKVYSRALERFFSLLSTKEIRVSDSVKAMSDDDLKKIDEVVAGCVREGGSYKTLVGMMQGLLTYTADVQSATIMWYIESILNECVGKSVASCTNDDGQSLTRALTANVPLTALIISLIHVMVGAMSAEIRNLGKLHTTTFLANLNANLLFSKRPIIAYVRDTMSCGASTSEPSTRGSLLEVLSRTGGPYSEGAPMSVLFTALAVSYEAHYDKFRVLDRAVKGEYLSNDIFNLGPPIFYPSVAFVFGPLALAVSQWHVDDSIENRAMASITSIIPEATLAQSSIWGNQSDETRACFKETSYVNSTHPLSRESRDIRFNKVASNKTVLDMASASFNGSMASAIMHSLSALRSVNNANPTNAVSTLYSVASTSYAKENRRMIAYDVDMNDLGKRSSRKLNMQEFHEELATEKELPTFRYKSILVTNLVTAVSNCIRAIGSLSRTVNLERCERRNIMYVAPFSDKVETNEVVTAQLATELFLDDAAGIRAYYLLKGVHLEGDKDEGANYLDIIEKIEITRYVVAKVDWKGYPRMVTNDVSPGDAMEAAVTVALNNIGMRCKADDSSAAAGASFVSVFDVALSEKLPELSSICSLCIRDTLAGVEPSGAIPRSVSDLFNIGIVDGVAQLKEIAAQHYKAIFKISCGFVANKFYWSDLKVVVSSGDAANILRRMHDGMAVAREKKVILSARGRNVQYIGVRTRTYDVDTRSYTHTATIFTSNRKDVTGLSRISGSMEVESKDFIHQRDVSVGMIGDMEVRVYDMPVVVGSSIRYFPPAFCIDVSGVHIPLYEVKDFNAEDHSLAVVAGDGGVVRKPSDVELTALTSLREYVESKHSLAQSVASLSINMGLRGALGVLWKS